MEKSEKNGKMKKIEKWKKMEKVKSCFREVNEFFKKNPTFFSSYIQVQNQFMPIYEVFKKMCFFKSQFQ